MSSSLERAVAVLDELRLERRVVLNVRRLIDAPLDLLGSGLVTDFSIGLPIDVFALDAREVTAIP